MRTRLGEIGDVRDERVERRPPLRGEGLRGGLGRVVAIAWLVGPAAFGVAFTFHIHTREGCARALVPWVGLALASGVEVRSARGLAVKPGRVQRPLERV